MEKLEKRLDKTNSSEGILNRIIICDAKWIVYDDQSGWAQENWPNPIPSEGGIKKGTYESLLVQGSGLCSAQ